MELLWPIKIRVILESQENYLDMNCNVQYIWGMSIASRIHLSVYNIKHSKKYKSIIRKIHNNKNIIRI